MTVNPYQSPTTDAVRPTHDDARASLSSTLAFGAYAGASGWATAGAASLLVVGAWQAWVVGEDLIAAAVGGAFFGCFAGGIVGAIAGIPCAWLVWRRPKNSSNPRGVSALAGCILVLIPTLLLLIISPAPLFRVLSDTAIMASFAAIALGLLTLGAASGLWFAQRVSQFTFSKPSRSGGF